MNLQEAGSGVVKNGKGQSAMTEINKMNISGGSAMAEGDGGGKLKLIIIAVVLLLLIGGGVAAAMMFLSGGEGDMAANGGAGGGSMAGVSPAAPQGSAIIEEPKFLALGTFIVNLADGRRYLKTTLELMMTEEAAKIYLEARLSEVKDLIVAELQTLSTEQLRDPAEREQLKQRLLSKVESLLPSKDVEWEDPRPIKKVLITEFYLQ